MIWILSIFTLISWFTPIMSVMPTAYVFSFSKTKPNNHCWILVVLYYIVMMVQSIAWCGFWGSVLMNGVCLAAYLVPILLFQKKEFNPMWKLLFTEVIFFLVSNFYSWVVMPEYTRDLAGIAMCYFAALPFFGKSLVSCFGFYALFTELQTVRIKNYGMSISR